MDTRVRGKLTKRLLSIARRRIDATDYLDANEVKLTPRTIARVPDCANCTDRCCVHREPQSGILLSLRDVAHLVDSGLGHLIVGKFTFRKDRDGRYSEDVDEMPKLAKQPDGNCWFYDEPTGRCNGYGTRPTICRRYPYEVSYRPGSGKPFARFIPWAKCPTIRSDRASDAVQQMIKDSVYDENIAFEDAMLIPDALDELRRAGFSRFLPPAAECPGQRVRKPARKPTKVASKKRKTRSGARTVKEQLSHARGGSR